MLAIGLPITLLVWRKFSISAYAGRILPYEFPWLQMGVYVGQKARYCQNGIWKTTGRVRQIIEQTEDYVKFETDSVRYCIDHYGREANVLALVA